MRNPFSEQHQKTALEIIGFRDVCQLGCWQPKTSVLCTRKVAVDQQLHRATGARALTPRRGNDEQQQAGSGAAVFSD